MKRQRAKGKKQKAKNGVFTGNYAKNPVTGENLPIWIADYVLMDETGGVRAGIPSGFEKDSDFAREHELPVVLFDSNRENTGESPEEIRSKIAENLGEKAQSKVKYKLRDWNISRERYWGAPIPIINCDSCGDQPVPREELPVRLPEIDDYKPTGTPPLARSEEFLHTVCPNCESPALRETKTLDTFVDSSWYYMRFADPKNKETMTGPLVNKWLPVDYYVGGADHTAGHLLYSRFITKVLSDLGKIDYDEPLTNLRHQGMILGPDGRKMSKRWGNTVDPLDVSNELGSDTLRIYEMFMGPLEQSKMWDTKAISGSRRFVDKIWQTRTRVDERESSHEDSLRINNLIASVTGAIESGMFNIVVSEFMKYFN